MAEERNALVMHIKNATLSDLDKQAAELRSRYEVYRTMRRITKDPGELKLDFNVRTKEGTAASGKGISGERLKADAARFRILEGIKQHVIANSGDVQSFDLAFDLSCRRIPDLIEQPTIPELPGGTIGPGF